MSDPLSVNDKIVNSQRRCGWCEAPLTGRMNQRWCSDQCLGKARAQRENPTESRACSSCGSAFSTRNRARRLCRHNCGRKWRKWRAPRKLCASCRRVFQPSSTKATTCGLCHTLPTLAACPGCGGAHAPWRHGAHALRFCKPACARSTRAITGALNTPRASKERPAFAWKCPGCGGDMISHGQAFHDQRCRDRVKRRLRAYGIDFPAMTRAVITGEMPRTFALETLNRWLAIRVANKAINTVRQEHARYA